MSTNDPILYLARRRRWRLATAVTLGLVGLVALSGLGRLGRGTFFSKAPLAELEQAAHSNPGDGELQCALGMRMLNEGREGDGYRVMHDLVRREPRVAKYWYGFGRAASIVGHAREAAGAYRKTLELDSSLDIARRDLARVYASAGLYDDAIPLFAALERSSDPNLKGDPLYGQCLLGKGRVQEAWDMATRSALRWPMQDQTYDVLAQAGIALGRLADTQEFLVTRLKRTPMYPVSRVRRALARVMLAWHRADMLAAAEEYARVAAEDDHSAASFATIAEARLRRGNLKGAAAAAQQGLKAEPHSAECLEALEKVAVGEGRPDETERYRRLAATGTEDPPDLRAARAKVAAAPRDASAHLALASALAGSGRPADAAGECYSALAISPSDRSAAELLASCRDTAIQRLETQAKTRTAAGL